MSRIYLLWAVIGSCSLSLASFIRGIESANPLQAKFALSLAYMIIASVHIWYVKHRLGDKFVYPWYHHKSDPNNPNAEKIFCHWQLIGILVGGTCENGSSLFVLLTFNAAANAGINQGIGTSIMVAMTVFVTISSFIFFRERISVP